MLEITASFLHNFQHLSGTRSGIAVARHQIRECDYGRPGDRNHAERRKGARPIQGCQREEQPAVLCGDEANSAGRTQVRMAVEIAGDADSKFPQELVSI
jgi:hypothetical protein